MRGTYYPGVCTKPGTYYQGWFMYMRYTQGPNKEYLLSRSTCILILYVQWVLVYPTTFVPHKTCQINQVLDKPGVG